MKKLRNTLLGLAILALVTILTLFIHRNIQASAAAKYRAEIKALGGPTELSQALPPTPTADNDGMPIFRQMFAWLDTNENDYLSTNYFTGMQPVAPGKALVSWQQPDYRDAYQTNSWSDLDAALARDQSFLALAATLTNHPQIDFNIHYDLGCQAYSAFTNLALPQQKHAAFYLCSAATDDLYHGRTDAALNHVRPIFTLAQTSMSQRFLISYLVGLALLGCTEYSTWDILQATNLTDIQLANLQQMYARFDLRSSYLQALNMERLCQEISLQDWRRSDAQMKSYMGASELLPSRGSGVFSLSELMSAAYRHTQRDLWRYWYSYPDELRFLQGSVILLQTAQFTRTNENYLLAWQNEQTNLALVGLTNSEYADVDPEDFSIRNLLSFAITDDGYVFRHFIQMETSRRLTLTAIALQRYQLKHGDYPDQLAQLTPDLLPTVPLDPMNGQPLRYHRLSPNTFLLYSVGQNGIDDGGNPAPAASHGHSSKYWLDNAAPDWVWPQPATPAETTNFYAHPTR